MRYFFYLLALCLAGLGCASPKVQPANQDALPATALQPFGRTLFTPQQSLELISSAAHFGFSFEGPECQVLATLAPGASHNYLQYELDGVYQKRVRINGSSNEPIVIKATGGGKHTVWVYKATEAHTGPVYIETVKGKNIQPLQRPAAPLIEFIGNSITCGAAADPSDVPCGTGVYHDQHHAYQAYGPRVARALGANFILSSVSGIGIYRNWNSDGPAMPQVFEAPDFQAGNAARWDFSKYRPQVVSIALGTNDFSNGDGKKPRLPFDSAAFVNAYVQFVQLVKSKYPDAQIALLSSPMVKGAAREKLQNCLAAVKAGVDARYSSGKRVELFYFKPMDARGCTGHPNVEDHALLAQELEPFFKKLLQQ